MDLYLICWLRCENRANSSHYTHVISFVSIDVGARNLYWINASSYSFLVDSTCFTVSTMLWSSLLSRTSKCSLWACNLFMLIYRILRTFFLLWNELIKFINYFCDFWPCHSLSEKAYSALKFSIRLMIPPEPFTLTLLCSWTWPTAMSDIILWVLCITQNPASKSVTTVIIWLKHVHFNSHKFSICSHLA